MPAGSAADLTRSPMTASSYALERNWTLILTDGTLTAHSAGAVGMRHVIVVTIAAFVALLLVLLYSPVTPPPVDLCRGC